jgi:hypothetical protein
MKTFISLFVVVVIINTGCGKKSSPAPSPPGPPPAFASYAVTINGHIPSNVNNNTNTTPLIKIAFTAPVDPASATGNVNITEIGGSTVPFVITYQNSDSTILIQPSPPLHNLTKYTTSVSTGLKSKLGGALITAVAINFATQIDSADKFPRIADDALLDLVQRQTFKYFWDLGHPISGMALDRNSSGDVVTTGGTGFGVMSIIAAVSRSFITRTEGFNRINTIVNFLKNNCTRYHGAFAHWVNGASGITVPFSVNDDGADLVETSLLMQGLLCARQYFNTSDAGEVALRATINALWDGIEWNWFRQGGQEVLYWHWSPNFGFQINQAIQGWDEALIVYALAASSNTDSISKGVYDSGWALSGGIINGASYYGIQLPLGPALGGPLFFTHYSFLGINPHDLIDAYANYFTQNTNHTLINYSYCVANPGNFYGYSAMNWGLTASDDDISGYDAHSPDNDDGVITPSAAISSLPYTPVQSMNALKFFYYTLGDRLWQQYGFVDAFSLNDTWFANSFLAIDQGPEIVMIENYRSGLLWNLFMSCPEIKRGMKQLGFQSPNL